MPKRLVIVRGNDVKFEIKVRSEGLPVNIETIDIFCEVKDRPGGNLLFEAIVTKTDAENGIFEVWFPRDRTAGLNVGQRVYFDFRFVFADGTEKNYPVPPFEAFVVERVTD